MKLFRLLNQLKLPTVILLGLALLVITNTVISILPFRLDLSKGQAYTLSSSTKKIVRELKNPVTIKFYASSELPSRMLPLKTEVADFLNEYKKENSGKIVFKITDPKSDTTAANEIKELSIPELQFSQLDQNKYQLSSAYFALGLFSGDKKEVIPQVTDITSLEYNVTSLLYKMGKKEQEKIGTIGIDPSLDPNSNPYGEIISLLEQQYSVEPLHLESEEVKSIDSSYQVVLLIDNNKNKYTENEIEKIKQYIENKGKIIFLVDGVWVNNDLTTQEAGHNLFGLLRGYNIELQKNFVLSESAEYVNFGNNLFQFLTPYPFWVKTNNFTAKNEYFSNVSSLTFPWVTSVSLNTSLPSIQTIVSSPPGSWKQTNNFQLNPQKIPQPQSVNEKGYPLIVKKVLTTGGALIVIPSSRFLTSQYLGRNSGNIDFFFNLMNNLASGGALTGIRSRSLSFYPLPVIPDTQKDLIKYTNILLLPCLFGLCGAIRLWKRK